MDCYLGPQRRIPFLRVYWHSFIIHATCSATIEIERLTLTSESVMKLDCYHDHTD